jgi:hypothetical protein
MISFVPHPYNGHAPWCLNLLLGAIAEHGLLQLRIAFIRDSHNVQQYLTEVDVARISLQRAEDAHFQEARFFHQHGSGVALLAAQLSVSPSCQRN